MNQVVTSSLLVLWLKIVNSAVMIGLYYGFLSTFSIGPSYLFLIRARVMEEGPETEISATTGFITGQLVMFISIYYAPFHLALSRPHTITALTLPYLFFNFVHKNDTYYYSDPDYYWLNSEYKKNQNSIRNFRIYKVFFNNLFFQFLNPLLFPTSILIRLMNIYLFRSNNKLVFLTSSFVGWLIGHIFLMKCIGLILVVWLQQKNLIKSKLTMRFDKYTLLLLRDYAGQIFVVFSFVIFAHCLGRIPLPYSYSIEDKKKKQMETDETNENDVDEIDWEREETKQEQKGSIKEDLANLASYLFPKKDKTFDNIEDENNLFEDENNLFEDENKPLKDQQLLVTTLFDYRRWNMPLRYIKNDHLEKAVRDENSQFFFHICQSDGKERISFTYPPHLSTFLKLMKEKMDLFTRDKIAYNDNELSNYWSSTIKEKRKKLSNEFLKRAKVLDKKSKKYKKFLPVDIFENRVRLSKDTEEKEYLLKIYDPFLSGRFRGQLQKSSSPLTRNDILINKIHGLLLSSNSNDPELEHKIDQFDRKSLLTEIGFFVNLMSEFSEKSASSLNFDGLFLFPEHEQVEIFSEEKERKKKFLFDAIRTDENGQTIFNKKCPGIDEIRKEVPRWSHTLVDDVEQLMETVGKDAEIRCTEIQRHVYLGETESMDFIGWGAKKKEDIDNTQKKDIDNTQKKDIDNTQKKDIDNPINRDIDNTQKKDIDNPINRDIDNPINRDIDNPINRDIDIDNPINIDIENPINIDIDIENPINIDIDIENLFNIDIENPINRDIDNTQKKDIDNTQKKDIDNTQKKNIDNTQKKDIDNTQKKDIDNTQKKDIENPINIDIDIDIENLLNIDDIDNINDKKKDEAKTDKPTEYALVYYSREPDYCRELIRGSMRNQRRKTVTWKIWQGNVHSPIFMELKDASTELVGYLFDDIYQSLKECFGKPRTDTEILDLQQRQRIRANEEEAEDKFDAEMRLREIEESWESILYGLIIRSFILLTQSILRKYIVLPSLIITKNIIRILLLQNPEWSEDFRDLKKEVHIKCTYQGVPVSQNELPKNWFNDGIQIRILSPFVLKPWHNSKVKSTEKKKDPLKKKKRSTEDRNFWFLTAYGTLTESYLDYHVPIPYLFSGPFFKKIKKQLKKQLKKYLKNHFFLVLKVFNERKKWFRTMLNEIKNGNIESLLFGFKKIDKLSESKKISTISNNNPIIEESPVIIEESISWTNSSFTEKRIKDLNVKTKTIIKQIEKMTEEKKEGIITSEINLNSKKTTYDAKILELQKKILQLQRRNIRLIRKSYSFFKIFIERVYIDILLCIISNTRIHGQRFVDFLLDFLEPRNTIVNKSISKNEERIDKTNQSIIPFMSIIDKSWNITNMNSKNSCDVSSLSQAYVLFKLSQIQVRNGYKYKLRSIFESHGRSFFLKKEIKDYFLRIQGINSKLRHKNRPNSLMNQWTNWLKVHYQYNLPWRTWSRLRLLSQNWRNRINEHRVAQNKDLVEYDSYEKTQLILYKKEQEQVELLERKKKIKKQYRYDLFSYQHINYADKKKSYIYGYRSNKNQATSYNYNTSKGELLDIIVDSSIQNYIEDSMEKKLNRKYFNWMGMNVERKKNSIPNPQLLNSRFWFFSKLRILFDAYRKNPFSIVPMYSLFSGNDRITKLVNGRTVPKEELKTPQEEPKKELKTPKEEPKKELKTAKEGANKEAKEEANKELKIRFKSSKYYHTGTNHSRMNKIYKKYRTTLKRERDFLLERYVGVYLNCGNSVQETLLNNVNVLLLLLKMQKLKKFVIKSIKKGDLDMDYITYLNSRDFSYTECRDTTELSPNLVFLIEPIRISRKNYEEFFIYKMTSVLLKRKEKFWPEKSRVDQQITKNKDKKHSDLLVPENLLSTRRRRELRILICLDPKNRNTAHRNTRNDNENKKNNSCQILAKNKDLDSETKKLMNLKLFLWPNYRLEDLACINRYWFDTHNGSRFSILRLHMYPRLKI
uniref:Protein TIC 214 n=1 Tax=Trifolium semipilosum TaxID=74529 RepID=A0A0A0QJF0_TRISM|nr:hypothetical chloroplast RF19 [Trifolium semipilosum]